MASNSSRMRPMGMATPNSTLPVVNSNVERRHQSLVQKSMDERLWRVKSQVDTRRSGEGIPSLIDAKGRMTKLERAKQIQKENSMLLNKLQAIRMSQAPSNLRYIAKPGLLVQPGGTGPKIDMGIPETSSSTSSIRSSLLKLEITENMERQNRQLKEKVAAAKSYNSFNTLKKEADRQELRLQMLRRRPAPAWGLLTQHAKPWDSSCGTTGALHRPSNAEASTSTCSLPQVAPKRTMSSEGLPRLTNVSSRNLRRYGSADGGLPETPSCAPQRPVAKRERFSGM